MGRISATENNIINYPAMNTQSLNELETIEQRLNELIAEATDLVIKGRLNSALAQITTVLDEAFKD